MPNTKHNGTIKYYYKAESNIYVENRDESKDSVFSTIYESFFQELQDYIAITNNSGNNFGQKPKNNIFAFIGERGAGKTSCMYSITHMLNKNENDLIYENEVFAKQKFAVLPSIDPSFFDKNTNILDVFLGQIFSDFKKDVESGNENKTTLSQKQDILEKFEIVKNTISYMNQRKYSDGNCLSESDNVEKLIDLSASVNLESSINKLISAYLNIKQKNILVLPIDDIDLHSSCGYEMVEQIRKYLNHSNVVILMALKITQLDKVVEKEFYKEYKLLLESNNMSSDTIADMANKYLIKLIPENHRFELPSFENLFDNVLDVYLPYSKQIPESKSFLGSNWIKDEKNSGYHARYAVTKLIFNKTRYLFYHTKGTTSLIVPRTLREFNQLLSLLIQMKDKEESKDNIVEFKENQQRFSHYFTTSWARSTLTVTDSNFITNLFNIADIATINKTVVRHLHNKYLEDGRGNPKGSTKTIDFICNEFNTSYNISLGDINKVIQYIKQKIVFQQDKAFLFAIETFYSMRLYDLYDLKTEQDLKTTTPQIEENIRQNSLLNNISDYDILSAGDYFDTFDYQLLPQTKGSYKLRRDWRVISLKTIQNEFKTIEDKIESESINNNDSIKELRLIEFFALMISRRFYKKYQNDNEYRKVQEIIWQTSTSNVDYVCFDVLAFFFNLNHIEECYKRIDENLYTIATKKECDSLYNRIKKTCIEKRTNGIESFVSIRNMEVLNDFLNSIAYTPESKYQGSDREVIIKFFNNVNQYNIRNYLETNNGDWHAIEYNFVKEFQNVLNEADNKTFDKLFAIQYSKASYNEYSLDDDDKKIIYPPSYEVSEDIFKEFSLAKNYHTEEIRATFREVLKSKEFYNQKMSQWITRNIPARENPWRNSEIQNLVDKFIAFYKKNYLDL